MNKKMDNSRYTHLKKALNDYERVVYQIEKIDKILSFATKMRKSGFTRGALMVRGIYDFSDEAVAFDEDDPNFRALVYFLKNAKVELERERDGM